MEVDKVWWLRSELALLYTDDAWLSFIWEAERSCGTLPHANSEMKRDQASVEG